MTTIHEGTPAARLGANGADRERAASILLMNARVKARFVHTAPASDSEDAIQDVLIGLMAEYDAGVGLEELVGRLQWRLKLAGIGYYRKARLREGDSLDRPVSAEDSTPLGERVPSRSSLPVEEVVIAHERLASLGPEVERLEAFLAEQDDPKLAMIHRLACSGATRAAIAAELTDAGHPIKPNTVDQTISRKLRRKFPELSFLWDQQKQA